MRPRPLDAEWLPINRKERFYTGTVFPAIVGVNDLRHVDRIMRLCGLEVDTGDPEETIQFLTEYSIKEALIRPSDRARFPNPPATKDTPDIVILSLRPAPALLYLEAKMFMDDLAAKLGTQVQAQLVQLDYVAACLGIPPDRRAHRLLLPAQAQAVVGGTADTITWQQVIELYRDVAPGYWVNVLQRALDSHVELVARPVEYGRNADAGELTGAEIVRRHRSGTLDGIAHVGRGGGVSGSSFMADVQSGRWRTQTYEVSRAVRPANRNWFSVDDFVSRVSPEPSPAAITRGPATAPSSGEAGQSM